MFFSYLGRELRRRMRQAIVIALGLALGIGLVITVEAASSGVNNSQTTVLHSLYGVGTDMTVTMSPTSGQARSTAVSFRQQVQALKHGGASLSGQTIHISNLINEQYGTMTTANLAKVAGQAHVTGAVGGLTLVNTNVTVTVPSVSISKSGGSNSLNSDITTATYSVEGVDTGHLGTGPMSGNTVTSGTNFTAATANSDDAVLDSGYASQQKLKVGSSVQVGSTEFKVIGIVNAPQEGSPPNVYIPLAKAQSIGKTGSASLKNEINTMYVTTGSAADISSVVQHLPGHAEGDDHRSERPGKRGHRLAVERVDAGERARQMAVAGGSHRGLPGGEPAYDERGVPAGTGVRHAEGARLAKLAGRPAGRRRVHGDRHRGRCHRRGHRLRRRRCDQQDSAEAHRHGGLAEPGRV